MPDAPSFVLRLQDATRVQEIAGVRSFVGEDASGGFGILAGHERFMTALVFGLARFCGADGRWRYLALPGGLLTFGDGRLEISTRRFLIDEDYERISAALERTLAAEEQQLRGLKDGIRRMEEGLLKRMWEMGRDESFTA